MDWTRPHGQNAVGDRVSQGTDIRLMSIVYWIARHKQFLNVRNICHFPIATNTIRTAKFDKVRDFVLVASRFRRLSNRYWSTIMNCKYTKVAGIIPAIAGLFAYFSLASTPESPKPISANARLETAIFAGGCFWCVEASFEKVHGVAGVESGYTGGELSNPTYEQVSSQTTKMLQTPGSRSMRS